MGNEGSYRQRLSTFAANWRVLALRGLAAPMFGVVVLFQSPFAQPRAKDVVETSL